MIKKERVLNQVRYSALKGIQDILPPDIYIWQKVENTAREIFYRYGFQEIKIPIIEYTDLFIRSIGETTDIVEKEMYTFLDKAGRSITMRPEGTAPAVRCYVEHHLYNLPSPQKFFYSGPMFRYERPQKGRFRQFYQIGVEAFGVHLPSIDAEIILMLKDILQEIGLKDINFEINSIGCEKCRPLFKKALIDFFSDKISNFCPDCQRRFSTNPLRILDCKVERCIELRQNSPNISNYLCDECKEHFEELLFRIDALKISYKLNPNLVRGLDYYTKTTFEVTSEHLGAQKAVAAGGRYDRLVEEFGGPKTPAIGFAIGMERIVSLLKETWKEAHPIPKIFIATIGRDSEIEAFKIAKTLRKKGLWVEVNYGGASLKSQLRKADRLGSEFVIILGEDELKTGRLQLKDLRSGHSKEIEISKITEIF